MERNHGHTQLPTEPGINQPKTTKVSKFKKHIAVIIPITIVTLGLAVYFLFFVFYKHNEISFPFPTPSTQLTNLEKITSANDDFIPAATNELFVATYFSQDNILNITIFNPMKYKIIKTKQISVDDMIPTGRGLGTSYSVQYNQKTKEIFFITQGYELYGGFKCFNKDGTCASRLYKIGLNQDKPSIIFESKDPPTNWIINNFDNSLLLLFSEDKNMSIKKINAQDGKIFFEESYLPENDTEFGNLVLSRDGKYTYQAILKNEDVLDEGWHHDVLKLRKIDNSNGNITEQQISRSNTKEAIWCETNLSPNDKYFAFYSFTPNTEIPAKINIYEISTNRLIFSYPNSPTNYELYWSGDSKKLMYHSSNSLSYYDITISKNDFYNVEPGHVYAWAPSVNYFVYAPHEQGQDIGSLEFKVFNIQGNEKINTQIKNRGEVGVSLY